MKVPLAALLLVCGSSASAFAPAFGVDKNARVVLSAEVDEYVSPEPAGVLNFQDKLGSNSGMSLSNVDTTQLMAIHPDRVPPRLTAAMLPPTVGDSTPLSPAFNNFQGKLESNSRMSLSNVDSIELTASHPSGNFRGDYRPEFRSSENAAYLTPAADETPLPPAITNFQNELGSNSRVSLSNVDSVELTAIHPTGNFRPEFSSDST